MFLTDIPHTSPETAYITCIAWRTPTDGPPPPGVRVGASGCEATLSPPSLDPDRVSPTQRLYVRLLGVRTVSVSVSWSGSGSGGKKKRRTAATAPRSLARSLNQCCLSFADIRAHRHFGRGTVTSKGRSWSETREWIKCHVSDTSSSLCSGSSARLCAAAALCCYW